MKTSTGRYIDPFKLVPSDISINDIANHLSKICRFNGACKFHYSVAQHSVYVSYLCKTSNERLAGLLHDASEAYICDIPSPLKNTPQFEFYRELEAEVQGMINEKFGLPREISKTVHRADKEICMTEGIQLMNELYTHLNVEPADLIITEITPKEAEEFFLREYQNIMTKGALLSTLSFPSRAPDMNMH